MAGTATPAATNQIPSPATDVQAEAPATSAADDSVLTDIRLDLRGHVAGEVDGTGIFIVDNPKTGALSALNNAEMIAFEWLGQAAGSALTARAFLMMLGQSEVEATGNINRLITRLASEGWTRSEYPVSKTRPLSAVYFTLTRECNLACPYCYQGLRKRARKIMSTEAAAEILDKIAAVNDEAHVIVTGGEPMMHPRFLEIMELIAGHGFSWSLLTHGGYIDDEIAVRLAIMPGLERVQVSLDGMTEEVHAISRGPRSYAKTVVGIKALAKAGAPLLLAPTIHDGNAHQILDIAHFAFSLGGSISANDLQQLPQDENTSLVLSPETRMRVKAELSDFLTRVMQADEQIHDRVLSLNTRSCSADPINSHFICGVAYSLVDIDWNGDIYPCHLLKGENLALGNIFLNSFDEIFLEGHVRGWRTKSYEIDNCSSCSFMSTCGSGCRAETYFAFGTPQRSSPTCGERSQGNTRRMLKMKDIDI